MFGEFDFYYSLKDKPDVNNYKKIIDNAIELIKELN